MSRRQNPLTYAGVSTLVAVGVASAAFAGGPEGSAKSDPASTASVTRPSAGTVLALLPIPANYVRIRDADVVVDGAPAQLIRYERADHRNAGLGGEHFSAVVDPSGKLKGFARMDLALRGGALPDQGEAQAIALRFLSSHAPDLVPNLRISFIAPHDETVLAEGRPVTITGMKVKMRNTADGRWFWVVVGADRDVMVFERDIVWANLEGRRTTELWLHDRWLAENESRLAPRDS